MNIDVKIDKDEVNKMVADAILKSAIGEELERIINETVSKMSSSYNNPIEPVVKQFINNLIRETIMEKHKEKLRAFVEEQLTDEMLTKLFQKLWDAVY